MTIRIIHVCAYFAPAFVYGGPPRSILALCRAQQDAGASVGVITTTANGGTELPDEVIASAEYEGIPVHYCARAWPRSVFHAPSLGPAVAEALRDADVLHIHGLWNAAVWSAAAVAREQQRPYVLSPRGMLAPAALAHDAWRKRLVYPVADRQVIAGAARLHATSRMEFDDIASMRGRDRAVYIPNGVDVPTTFTDDPRAARNRLGLAADEPIVLFLGRLHPIKRLDLLAEAFGDIRARHRNARLVIAGPDEQAHRAAIAPLFTKYGSAVTWTGRIDGPAKNEWIEASSVLVLCSNSESFGMSAAEAMAASRPVVVTRTCPWPDIESAQAGRWVEQTPSAIADAVVTVLSDEPAAHAMGRRGRALITNHYSWRHAAAALLREYETIASPAARIA